ncbi:MAG: hypothetical protein J5910_07060 [Lachnospiraceae bacterium]|nr:hypothetical protein [Lachnospiraceae bacterium]
MKIIIAAGLTVAVLALLHIPILRKKRIILALYAIGMILFFVAYNVNTLDNNIRFYRPKYQTVYQPEFFETKEYPDAFLDEFFKGKTVYTPNDAYDTSKADELSEDLGDYWLYYWYHAINIWDYLEFNKATIVKDDKLNEVILSDEQKMHFEDLGPANDMLRYTFPLSPYDDEWGNAFYHYWFYNTFIGDSRVYICTEGLADNDEIVLLWQHEDVHDTESYYIASKDYYDKMMGL